MHVLNCYYCVVLSLWTALIIIQNTILENCTSRIQAALGKGNFLEKNAFNSYQC